MKYTILWLLFFLVSCGGGDSDLPPKEQSKEFNGTITLNSTWIYYITVPGCEQSYFRILDLRSNNGILGLSHDYGDYPDLNSIASCSIVRDSLQIDLDPYPVVQNVAQFKEMLIVKYQMELKLIEIITFGKQLVVFNRTVKNDKTGDSIWNYRLIERVPVIGLP